MIPKTIHYFWFGHNPKSDLIKKCIFSWGKFMPDYEIIEWNESNYNIHTCAYVEEAYKAKRWAFVSDYARFDILNQYGGIYVDTDVEFLKTIPKEIINNKAFTGLEPSGIISPGLIFGAEKGFPVVNEIVNLYKHEHFIDNQGKEKLKTVNSYFTDLLIPHGFKKKNEFQIIDDLAIYPSSFFCGFDLDVMEPDIKPETISIHHYAGTWNSQHVKKDIQKALKVLFGIEGYRKILTLVRKIRNDEN